MGFVFGVGGTDDGVEQGHPSADQDFELCVYFVVHCFPEELDAEIDDFGLWSTSDQVEENWKD